MLSHVYEPTELTARVSIVGFSHRYKQIGQSIEQSRMYCFSV